MQAELVLRTVDVYGLMKGNQNQKEVPNSLKITRMRMGSGGLW